MRSILGKSRSGLIVLVIGALSVAVGSCADSETPPDLELMVVPTPPDEWTPGDMLRELDAVTGGEGAMAESVADVRAMIQAQHHESLNEWPQAVTAWRTALQRAEGPFGKNALEGWIKAYSKQLGKQSDRLVLARLLLAEMNGGQSSRYMQLQGLTTDVALLPLVEKLVPEWLTPVPPGMTTPTTLEPPPLGQFPAADPLLTASAARRCGGAIVDDTTWGKWLASQPVAIGDYWRGISAQCANQSAEALAALRSAYPKLAQDKKTQAHAVEAASRVATLERALIQRAEAADTYNELMRLWQLPTVTPKTMGLDDAAFAIRRIDESLWASRYRTMVSDYENAKVHAQAALNHVATALTNRTLGSSQTKEKLAALRAEAYHTLAYRIAVEEQQYDSALSMTLLGLQSPYLDREWKDRLQWFAGVYDYLAGRFESAKKKWEKLLEETKEDHMRAMLYFWLAKAYDQMGQKAESRFYLAAGIDDYPISYYSTVAPLAAGFEPPKDWRKVFGDPSFLALRLKDTSNMPLDRLRRHKTHGRLVARAEVLAAAKLTPWFKLAADELDTAMTNDLTLDSNIPAFVYLSRLHYAAGSYLKTIALTTKLIKAEPGFWKKYPEQILVYFAQPYREIYERNALEQSIDKELLMAISRQESGFTADIRSSANALGVMQLIRPTAERFASELGLPADDLDTLLKTPAANIRMGARYLKVLQLTYKGYEPAVYGGYNAGEYSVDLWLKRRAHSDVLMFVELVPFGETKDYIKNVWRNVAVYRFLAGVQDPSSSDAKHEKDSGRTRADNLN
jgi:soluble lytic murein transglycosylase-like protein